MRTAIVGLGVIGKLHARIVADSGELAAVCDILPERTSGYGASEYADYIKMLDEAKPDVVHICTPHYLHADMVINALDRGINVLCEKPLCIKIEDIDRILEAEKRSTAILGVCQQNRYNSGCHWIKKHIEGKKVLGGHGAVVWNRDREYYAQDAWRGKRATEGGGILINQALHTLDMIEWFIGEPKYVSADVNRLVRGDFIDVEDTVSAVFGGEAEFAFFATACGVCDFPVQITLKVEDEIISVSGDTVTINDEILKSVDADGTGRKCCYGTGHEKLIADFYSCVRDGRKFWIDGREGAKVVRLILSCYASGGKKIKIL